MNVCVLKTPNVKTGISAVKIACCHCGNRTGYHMIEIPETEPEVRGSLDSEEKKISNETSDENKVIGSFFEDLRLDTFKATPGPMEFCENDGKVISFKIQHEMVIDNISRQSWDNTAMNSICFLCSGNDTICSRKGRHGEFHYSDPKRCHNGFSKVKMRVQEYQGTEKD